MDFITFPCLGLLNLVAEGTGQRQAVFRLTTTSSERSGDVPRLGEVLWRSELAQIAIRKLFSLFLQVFVLLEFFCDTKIMFETYVLAGC